MRENRQKYKLISKNMNDLIALMDLSGKITYASPSNQTFLGYPSSSFVGQTLLKFVHLHDIAIVMEAIKKLLRDREEMRIVTRLLHMDGHDVYTEIMMSFQGQRHNEYADSILIAAHDVKQRMEKI